MSNGIDVVSATNVPKARNDAKLCIVFILLLVFTFKSLQVSDYFQVYMEILEIVTMVCVLISRSG